MRFAILLALATALGAADVKPLGPGEDLPYCRVVENAAATIDRDPQVLVAHDGWYCAATRQLFPAKAVELLDEVQPIDAARIVSVTPAKVAPGRMPAAWRQQVNAYIAKHHPQSPDAPAAAKP